MRSLNNDLKFGMEKEVTVLAQLSQHFIEYGKITNTKELYKDPYYKYDFEAEDGTSFELKSRRNAKNGYPTTFLPVDKISRNAPHKQVYIFSFTDRLCKIEYNEDVWDNFEKREIQIYRYGRIDKPTLQFCIPIKLLIDIC